jgi:hypothetical protein
MGTLSSYDTLNPISYNVYAGGMAVHFLYTDTPIQIDNGLSRRAVRSEDACALPGEFRDILVKLLSVLAHLSMTDLVNGFILVLGATGGSERSYERLGIIQTTLVIKNSSDFLGPFQTLKEKEPDLEFDVVTDDEVTII